MAAISTGPILSSTCQRYKLPWPRRSHLLNTTPRGPYHLKRSRDSIYFLTNPAAGQPIRCSGLHSDLVGYTREVFDKLPQPIKNFPWSEALSIFQILLFGLVSTVTKYIGLPLLAISSLSEMAYCSIERKISVALVAFLFGIGLVAALNDRRLKLFPTFKVEEKPWHLVPVAAFLLLLKLVGPYCPYLLHLSAPHFANGGLWCTVWFMFMWYRKHHEATSL
ncbi:embryo defective 1273 [Rhynchospora pubera]|uniref:Embryo defective 1273 n=1 Tax=Rhynchospora pubera TaxID=906938 RepID=A0AAV8GCQ7_9POAL|nr:embryo defective 1273 [Rhynchospora pubera]